jgi:O-antigen ligase
MPTKKRFNLLTCLLVGMIIYIPNQVNIPVEFAIKGLNIINMMFTVTLLVLSTRGIHSQTPAPLKGSFFFLFAVLTLSYVIGAARDPTEWLEDFTVLKNIIFFMLMYFVYYRAAHDLKTVRYLFIVILFVTLVAAVQGLRQALDYGMSSYNETRRVSAPFGWFPSNANRSAAFFVIFLPLFLTIGFYFRSKFWVRIAGFACGGLCVFVVFFTYSRQAYFILAVLILLLTMKKNALIALIIGACLFSYEAWAPDTVIERIQSTKQEEPVTNTAPKEGAGEGKYDESTESRLVIWAGAGELISENPWGIGLNHFKREIGTYAPLNKNMDAHNVYVLFTTEAGILGPLALLILLVKLLILGVRTCKLNASQDTQILGIGYVLCVIAVMLSNIYGSRFFEGEVMGNFWILTALVAKYGSLLKEQQKMPNVAGNTPLKKASPMYA